MYISKEEDLEKVEEFLKAIPIQGNVLLCNHTIRETLPGSDIAGRFTGMTFHKEISQSWDSSPALELESGALGVFFCTLLDNWDQEEISQLKATTEKQMEYKEKIKNQLSHFY